MSEFSTVLLDWYQQHGRHDLPWQSNRSLYRVWVSEIMLQQTQVATVIPYFEKFIQRFPDIISLSRAAQDDVLLLWAGLGYYSRARNLHKTACLIAEQYDGEFPIYYDEVLALPGIGPSTAAAILAQATGQRHAILDGNVKRVLARHQAIDGWPGNAKVEKKLWQWAEKYTPQQRLADYTQAIMDLGATVCTRSAAKCDVCPLSVSCLAFKTSRVNELPTKKPKKVIPVRQKRLLIIRNSDGHYFMEKRPPAGIWGGLWSLPELDMEQVVVDAVAKNMQLAVSQHKDLPVLRHTFSHFHLDITPCEVQVSAKAGAAAEANAIAEDKLYRWCTDLSRLALAAPVSFILQKKIAQA